MFRGADGDGGRRQLEGYQKAPGRMDREQPDAEKSENGLPSSLSSKSQWPSDGIARGGIDCAILSRADPPDLHHVETFPATSAAMASPPSPPPSSVNPFPLPVMESKPAVMDADDQSLYAPSILPKRRQRMRKKAFSMDEIGLYSRLPGESSGMEVKVTGDEGLIHGCRGDELLFQVMPWEIALAAAMPPRLSSCRAAPAVPFKWEDVPGEPKPLAIAPAQHPPPCLQLPPRLYAAPTTLKPSKNTSRSNLHEKDEKIPDSLSPSSTLQAFDAQSPSSSTSPDIPTSTHHQPLLQLPALLYPSPTTKNPSKNTSRSNLHDKDKKIPHTSSPSSNLQAFYTPSPASSTSPDIPTHHTSSCGTDRLPLGCENIFRERSGSFITPGSPAADFGPSDATKGFSHMYSTAQHIKHAMKALHRRRYGGKRMHRSMDCDIHEVWSPTLAMYYQLHSNKRECGKLDEDGEDDPKVVTEQLSADLTLSAMPGTPQPVEPNCRASRNRLHRWIASKLRRSRDIIASSFMFPSLCLRPKVC